MTVRRTGRLQRQHRERAVGVLTRLRDSGVGIAIDDDGTGYSSLAYLAELQCFHLSRPLPPDQLAAWLQARTSTVPAPRLGPDTLPSRV